MNRTAKIVTGFAITILVGVWASACTLCVTVDMTIKDPLMTPTGVGVDVDVVRKQQPVEPSSNISPLIPASGQIPLCTGDPAMPKHNLGDADIGVSATPLAEGPPQVVARKTATKMPISQPPDN